MKFKVYVISADKSTSISLIAAFNSEKDAEEFMEKKRDVFGISVPLLIVEGTLHTIVYGLK